MHGEPHTAGTAPVRVTISRIALVAVLVTTGSMLVNRAWLHADYKGDEAAHIVMARNMLADWDYLVRPATQPLGDFEFERPAFTFPPVDGLVRALPIALLFGRIEGSALSNALTWCALLLSAYVLVRAFRPSLAPWVVLTMACGPGLLDQMSILEGEPTMAGFGLSGMALGILGHLSGRALLVFLGGLLIGIGFTIKVYLVLPFAAVFGAYVLIDGARRGELGRGVWDALRGGAGFTVGAASYLLVVLFMAPEEVGYWFKEIYLGAFLGSASTKFDADAVVDSTANHGLSYYPAILYRDHYALIPLLLVALLRTRRGRLPLPAALTIALWVGVAFVAPISASLWKEPLYILPSAILLYVLAGATLGELVEDEGPSVPERRLINAVGLLAGSGMLAAYALGIKPDDITRGYVAVHSVTWLLVLIATNLSARASVHWKAASSVLAGSLLGLVAFAQLRVIATNTSIQPHIAEVLRPAVASVAPGKTAFIGDRTKGIELLLWRRARSWTPPEAASHDTEILEEARAYVITPATVSPVFDYLLPWVEENAVEVTEQLDRRVGHVTGVRIWFRRDAAQPP